ncbi:hypothetical protein [Halobellus captivus]|uniref:hypothetical protein n=1 Tax=Halobellus captivus TaxID=2592614 RepID=UPI0011A7217E|nr:hypothetical protein [Halobellus captivus]
MGDSAVRSDGGSDALFGNAVRTPLPDRRAERLFHENMSAVAEGRERKAELLADPSVSVIKAYETEFERVAESFRRRLRHIAGDDYEEIAYAYLRGDREDRLGELTAYYIEGLWRIQQRSTISEMLFFPLIIRYPDSFTMNLRFAAAHSTTESMPFESPQHADIDDDAPHTQQYFDESQYEQERAADYLRETAQIIREQFPHPDEVPFEERKYGGVVSAGGRRESTFTEMLAPVRPDPGRFSESVTEATLVPAGTEAERTKRRYLPAAKVII